MLRRRAISISLVAVLFGQAIVASWHHSHCHHQAATTAEHSHPHGHAHAHGHVHHSHESEELPPVQFPTDEDNCTVCQHLTKSSLLTIDSDLASTGQTTISVIATDDSLVSRDIVGLRRPRSPPQLG